VTVLEKALSIQHAGMAALLSGTAKPFPGFEAQAYDLSRRITIVVTFTKESVEQLRERVIYPLRGLAHNHQVQTKSKSPGGRKKASWPR
jgi:hypothetical protein